MKIKTNAYSKAVLWFACVATCFSNSSQAADLRTEVQFGFPYILTLRLDHPISSRWRAGLGIGGLAVSAANLFYRPTVMSDISDEYNVQVNPDARFLTSSLFAEWQTESGASAIRLELLLTLLSAGAKTYVVNKNTRAAAPYLDIEVTALLPRIATSYVGRILKNETWNMYAGIGVTLLLTNQIFSTQTGPANAYFEAVPSTRDSLSDGLTNLDRELGAILSDTALAARILPAVWISASW